MSRLISALLDIFLILGYWIYGMILFLVPRSLRYKDVSREVVLITGAGSGIGRFMAVRFAKLGAKVVVWDLNKEGAEETVRIVEAEGGGKAYAYVCDVTNRQQVYEVVAKVKAEVGMVNILINNAGIVSGKRVLELDDEKIQKTFDVNVLSHYWTVKAFLPEMISSNHGHIVTVASIAGLSGGVRLLDYCASKFAAVGFEESLRLELHSEGHTGIHSTVVCPYYIDTGMFAGVQSNTLPLLKPSDVADEIVSAVRSNQEFLLIPRWLTFILILKSMLPTCAGYHLFHLFEGHSSMNTFVGRDGKQE